MTETTAPTSAGTPTAAPTFPTYTPVAGASVLAAGDVAFVGFTDTSTGKQLAFMLMRAVNAGTTVIISNNTWNGTALKSTTGGYITWTADQAYPAGTTVIYTRLGGNGNEVNIGYVEDGGNKGAGIGWSSPKLLTALQGTLASPTFLSAMLMGATWGDSSDTAVTVPTGLTDGVSAVAFSAFDDWGVFDNNCSPIASPVSGTEAQIDQQIYAGTGTTPTAWALVASDTADSLTETTGADVWSPCTPFNFTAAGSPTRTFIASLTVTQSPVESPTPSSTVSPSFTESPMESPTPSFSASPSFTASPTRTPSPSATATPTEVGSGTTLSPGDVMIVALSNSSAATGKQIALMLLKDVDAGTSFGIDNAGWNAGGFISTKKNYVVWTADQPYASGTVITYSRPGGDSIAVDKGSIAEGGTTSGGIGFSSPKLLVVFQGTTSNPVPINAVLMGTTWGSETYTAGSLPTGLVDGQTAVQFAAYPEWGGYNCSVATGGEAGIDAAIDDDPFGLPANWTISTTDSTDTLATYSPPWQLCSGSSFGEAGPYTPPQPPKPLVGPVPAHSGQDVHLVLVKAASSCQAWVYSLGGRLVSTLTQGSTGAGDVSWVWTTHSMAPGIYRVKAKVNYGDGSTYVGWLTVAIVP
jgi:hypothetical protein